MKGCKPWRGWWRPCWCAWMIRSERRTRRCTRWRAWWLLKPTRCNSSKSANSRCHRRRPRWCARHRLEWGACSTSPSRSHSTNARRARRCTESAQASRGQWLIALRAITSSLLRLILIVLPLDSLCPLSIQRPWHFQRHSLTCLERVPMLETSQHL